jgi:hypothetical protein
MRSYVDVIVQRWQTRSGPAKLETDGRTFEEIAAELPQAAAMNSAAPKGTCGTGTALRNV